MNFLEFANPSGWWWAAALAIPILLLYILKIRLRRQPISTLLFWDQLFDEKKPRAWWQRLRHLLSLLLQLAFVLLVVAALTDPLWSWQKTQQRRIVLVVDNSASMRATEPDGKTRLDKARQSAGALIRGLRDGDRMAILSAGGRSQVVIGMTDHQRSLLSAIQTLPATDGPTDVAAAITAAERLLTDEQPGEILVLSDGCFEGLADVQANKRVKVYGVGSAQDNVAITRYQVRRSLLDAIGYQVLIDVTNFSKEDRTCRVELNLGEELVDVLPLEIKPGATETRILDHTSTGGGQLIAKLDTSDALATDNTAIAVLPKRAPIPVLLVTKGNLFLKGVLESIPLVALQIVSEVPASIPPRTILVLDRIVPKQLPTGRVIVVDPQEGCDAWTLGEVIPQPIVASVKAESPLTQHVRLNNVLFPDARLLNFTATVELLIQDPLDQPLLARLRHPAGDAVVLTCSLDKGDLPLRIAFPVLMKNMIEHFQGNAGELRPAVASGTMLAIDVAPVEQINVTNKVAVADVTKDESKPGDLTATTDASAVTVVERAAVEIKQEMILVSPSQVTTPLASIDEQVTIGPLLETGLWTVRPAKSAASDTLLDTPVTSMPPAGSTVADASSATASSAALSSSTVKKGAITDEDDPRIVRVACNLVDAAESNLSPRGELVDVEGRALLSLGGQSLWFYLTILAAGLIATEWWLYQRRIVG